MNDPLNSTEARAARLDVDRLLREFYQAQMPHPWPGLALPRRAAVRPAARFTQHVRRFALAASVLLGLVAYWSLAGQLATESATPGLDPISGQIGQKASRARVTIQAPPRRLSPVEHQLTPAGIDAKIFEEDTPTGRAMILIGPSNTKGPR